VRTVAQKRVRPRRNEGSIVLTPNRQDGNLRLTEKLAEFRIKLNVFLIVDLEIDLNVRNPWPSRECRVEPIVFWRNRQRISHASQVKALNSLKTYP
jgi:hypothetical protein